MSGFSWCWVFSWCRVLSWCWVELNILNHYVRELLLVSQWWCIFDKSLNSFLRYESNCLTFTALSASTVMCIILLLLFQSLIRYDLQSWSANASVNCVVWDKRHQWMKSFRPWFEHWQLTIKYDLVRKLISQLSHTDMKIDIQNEFHVHSLQDTDCSVSCSEWNSMI
jgi:hypothetical protein